MGFSSDAPLVSNQVSDFDLPESYEEFSEIFDREHKKVIDTINTKEGALYLLQEAATYQQYFNADDPQNNRNTYRMVINFGALPNNTSKRVPHNVTINSISRVTRLYGAASNPSGIKFIPLPFASPTLANNVSLEADQTDIKITTGADYSSYTDTTVVFEYTKG